MSCSNCVTRPTLAWFALGVVLCFGSDLSAATAREVALGAGAPWPILFELDVGESAIVRAGESTTNVKLISVNHRTEPDYWTRTNPAHVIFAAAEELIVRADDGSEERDAIHVRVYGPEISRDITAGWLHYSPARAIWPGTTVTFWNRLDKIKRPASIDFGDGSPSEPIADEVAHVYQRAGLYTVALSARGITGERALLKVRLRVEPDDSGTKP